MKVDPIRVVEAVTAGVAFLAAGVVIFTRGDVHGLTTGAGMWLAGAIGLACGLGLWQIAAFSSLLTLSCSGFCTPWKTGWISTSAIDFSLTQQAPDRSGKYRSALKSG